VAPTVLHANVVGIPKEQPGKKSEEKLAVMRIDKKERMRKEDLKAPLKELSAACCGEHRGVAVNDALREAVVIIIGITF
jgi:hypothetical protein